MPILRLAIPSPLRRLFDYLPPAECPAPLRAGQRLLVEFARRQVVAVLVEVAQSSELPTDKLKPALRLLDPEPLLPPELLRLLGWAVSYYHHGPGEVYPAALPLALRGSDGVAEPRLKRWRITAAGRERLAAGPGRSPRGHELLERLAQAHEGVIPQQLKELNWDWRPAMRRLREQGLVSEQRASCLEPPQPPSPAPQLNDEQQSAVESVTAALDGYHAFLLDGVTGSGKTEVYLRLIEAVVARGRQALLLVPEIGLTPQTVARFRARIPHPIAVLHSGLADGERLCAWQAARRGEARVVIGTRSALFTPLAAPGIIIVDEEHDASFKQQDGFRYSARDLAVVRAHHASIPVLLGSATPALESLANARAGRYTRLALTRRAGDAKPPRIGLLDMRRARLDEGLSEPLLALMERHLKADGQVLLFLNRRGYAPTLLCHACGEAPKCPRCEVNYNLSLVHRRLRCHHCDTERPVPHQCPSCGSPELVPVGLGTERIEQALARRFPGIGVVRIDRDSTRRKGSFEQALAAIHSGEHKLLIGTQMLAKGHHFPNVTLVAILDADQGLYSLDFRAGERLAQLILQVAGRAGRAERPGEVVIQTHLPDHPLLNQLVHQGYPGFAAAALDARKQGRLPPYAHMALLRAEAQNGELPRAFLSEAYGLARVLNTGEVELLGPVAAPMEKRAGRYRVQLLLSSQRREALHKLLDGLLPKLDGLKSGRKVRWSLDVDPVDGY